MKQVLSILAILIFSYAASQNNKRAEVKGVIDGFVESVNKKDIKKIRTYLDQNVGFMTVFFDGAKSILTAENLDMYLLSVENSDTTKEVLLNYKISVSDVLATVWTDYLFYKGGVVSHCGENAFQLYKGIKGWKIIQITDSRKPRKYCNLFSKKSKFQRKAELINFIDKWHENAANGNKDDYFEAIAKEGIYIGTDPDEYWTKQAFLQWAEPYFKSGKTWDFKVIERNIYFSDDEDIAWFDEKLHTTMGVCRASGVVEMAAGGWKINHYHLSVTIPTEKLTEFVKLTTTKPANE